MTQATPSAFFPPEPKTFADAGVTETETEGLVLKLLMGRGDLTGWDIAEHLKFPFGILEKLLQRIREEKLLAYKSATRVNDYLYQLTSIGRERARAEAERCSYYGAVPVSLKDYIASTRAQTIEGQRPTREDLFRAFSDLSLPANLFERLGPAVASGRGMFLYGAPGNGKSSIAERITRAFGEHFWIPRALGIDGEIVRLFDPMNHEELPMPPRNSLLDETRHDRRWVRVKRPTIVSGGELTMDNLEVSMNTTTRVGEAPLQLKANCGTLVIDDLGRQRVRMNDLLNRLIVPLEKRYDYLGLANGKKIRVPFDMLVVFSTNLEPRDLVDEAFLRRIPYKIEVTDPGEDEYRMLFDHMCRVLGITQTKEAVDHLIDKHYKGVGRPFRRCQPRDLLLQVKSYCAYQNVPAVATAKSLDFAVDNYFALLPARVEGDALRAMNR